MMPTVIEEPKASEEGERHREDATQSDQASAVDWCKGTKEEDYVETHC